MHSKHLWRAMLILLVGGIGFVVARQLVIPKTFGATGHYRHDSLEEYRELPAQHGGAESCRRCHKEEKYTAAAIGKHAAVSCEVCHGPVALHADGQKKIADARKTPLGDAPSYRMCLICHQDLPSRPKTQPMAAAAPGPSAIITSTGR